MSFFQRNRAQLEKLGYSPDRLPPGQYYTKRFPVLHVGEVPRYDMTAWDLRVFGLVRKPMTFSFEELADVLRDDALLAWGFDGSDLAPEHERHRHTQRVQDRLHGAADRQRRVEALEGLHHLGLAKEALDRNRIGREPRTDGKAATLQAWGTRRMVAESRDAMQQWRCHG